jgi:hypothetical protein
MMRCEAAHFDQMKIQESNDVAFCFKSITLGIIWSREIFY